MANATGDALIQFGSGLGSNEASVSVSGQTAISSTSKVEAFVMGDDSTSDHTASDHRYFESFANLTCGTPSNGTGFTIYARSIHKLTGEWRVRWVWSD